jgi:hypothetical protein
MRRTVRDLIVANGTLTAVIPTERWYSPGGVLDHPVFPFAILRWIAPVSGAAKGSFSHQLRIDVHDRRGSYDRIEAVLGGPYRSGGVYPIIAGIAGVTGVDGYIGQTDFLGDSGDQEDEVYGSNYKFLSWQIMGRST